MPLSDPKLPNYFKYLIGGSLMKVLQLCLSTFIATLLCFTHSFGDILFEDDFESGTLGFGWHEYTTGYGRVDVASGYQQAGAYSLLLDCNNNGTYSYAAAIIRGMW